MKKRLGLSVCVLLLGIGLLTQHTATAEIIFSETFDNFSNGEHYGVPYKGPNGADEVWYAARFEHPDGGSIHWDVSVNDAAYPYDHYGRVEDDAGLLFKIDAGYEDITLSFDWRTHSTTSGDRFKAAYYIGNDLGFNATTRTLNFVDIQGGHNNAVAWYNANWNPLLSGLNYNSWKPESFTLDDSIVMGQEIWVAFWMDNGEGDKGKFDSVVVEASVIPEPAAALLLGVAALGLKGYRKLFYM